MNEPMDRAMLADALTENGKLKAELATARQLAEDAWQRLEILCGASLKRNDNRRIIAALGATIGISTEALERGHVWTLIQRVGDLLDSSKRMAERQGHQHAPDNCPGCRLERAFLAILDAKAGQIAQATWEKQ